MKKGKLILFSSVLISSLSLSGCILSDLFSKKDNDSSVTPASINVVSSLKLNLQGTSVKSLSPTLSDSSIKNPVFEYSSSNESVATVTSDGVVSAVSVGKCYIHIILQNNSKVQADVEVEVIDKSVDHYDYTLMFYMCGSDLENNTEARSQDDHGFFTKDIQEILSVEDIPNSVRIIIETGGTTKWQMPSYYLEGASQISSTKLQRWEVNNETNKLKLIDTLNTNKMANEDSFTEFLSWGLDEYEADQMGVVISGHGGGIAGCAFDDNYLDNEGFQNTLQTYEVANAAKTALSNSTKDKFTWIGYDCCLMQCADIATINADYFDYMVASQELEDAIGWNHDVYLPYLAENTNIEPKDFLPKICDSFLLDKHAAGEKNACLQTLSVLDLSKVSSLISAFEAIVPQLGSTSTAYIRAKNAFEAAYNEFGEGMFGLCDFTSLLQQLQSKYGVNTTAAQSAVNDLVYYSKYCSKYSLVPCGVNAFFPDYIAGDKKYVLQVGRADYSNKNSTKFSKWQTLCLSGNDFGW